MQFVKNGPDVLERLIQAHEEGRGRLLLRCRHIASLAGVRRIGVGV